MGNFCRTNSSPVSEDNNLISDKLKSQWPLAWGRGQLKLKVNFSESHLEFLNSYHSCISWEAEG